jgi:hypothetical protein
MITTYMINHKALTFTVVYIEDEKERLSTINTLQKNDYHIVSYRTYIAFERFCQCMEEES